MDSTNSKNYWYKGQISPALYIKQNNQQNVFRLFKYHPKPLFNMF